TIVGSLGDRRSRIAVSIVAGTFPQQATRAGIGGIDDPGASHPGRGPRLREQCEVGATPGDPTCAPFGIREHLGLTVERRSQSVDAVAGGNARVRIAVVERLEPDQRRGYVAPPAPTKIGSAHVCTPV